ncbi:hypothetical protein MTO96_040037 [Rhipicephalus appendiculatus]
MQYRLQWAVREVERHIEDRGVTCCPVKSEVLLHRPRKKGPHPQALVDARRLGIHVSTREGTRIPKVPKIRVLGLWPAENGAESELVARLQKRPPPRTLCDG